jgi:hypothetical protein
MTSVIQVTDRRGRAISQDLEALPEGFIGRWKSLPTQGAVSPPSTLYRLRPGRSYLSCKSVRFARESLFPTGTCNVGPLATTRGDQAVDS